MEKFRTKLRRFYFRIKHDYLSFDNVIFFIAIIACFFWTYSSLSATSKNWELSKKLAEKNHERMLLQIEVDTLDLENTYYRSTEYQELSARAKLDKVFEGEHLVVLPENSEAAKNKYNDVSEDAPAEEPSNFSEWMSFLLGS